MKLIAPAVYLMCLALLPSVALAKGEKAGCDGHNVTCSQTPTPKASTNKGKAQKPQQNKQHTQTKKVSKVPVVKKKQTVKKPVTFHAGMHVVTSKRLNIRSQPTTHSRVLGGLRHGMKVKVIRQQGAWREIVFNNQHAWVYSAYLKAVH